MIAATRIGIVGTFDVMNFGDLLFPLLAGHELRARLDSVEIVLYSHNELAPPAWPFEVRALHRLPEELDELRLLLVGGGHVVRFDKDVAPDYDSKHPDVHHPTGYWLTPTLVAAARGVPVAWNAVGVSPETPAWATPLLTAALDLASYVSVRDEPSASELRALSPTAEVRVTPDTAFGVQRILPLEPSDRFRRFVQESGLRERYVIVQASPHLPAAVAASVAPLPAAGISVLELPISPVHGDRAGILALPDCIAVKSWREPLFVAELIARAEAVVAQSLHLSIVAFANGVPVYRVVSPAGEKYQLIERFERVHLWPERNGAGALTDLGRRPPGPEAAEQSAKVARHWDAIASLLDGQPPKPPTRLAALLSDLTGRLERGSR